MSRRRQFVILGPLKTGGGSILPPSNGGNNIAFNSLTFCLFFIIIYSLYLVLNHRWQNRLLLAASYVFYGWWDWRFLSLLGISTLVDYFCSLKIASSVDPKIRKKFLLISLCVNLGMLGFFKYFNFFAGSFSALFALGGWEVHPLMLHIILPIGISFYTFQTMGYVIDVYRKQLDPPASLLDFALFVSFFPQLVAGPIERANHLLPQVIHPRTITWDQVYEGGYLLLWGFFKKLFVADNLARLADAHFKTSPPYNGVLSLMALYGFAFQIYCDFSAYSDIARGVAKGMGFELMVNFNLPYFSTNPRQFWKRWHISLSTWLKDYLYIPLGGNRKGAVRTYLNLFLVMLLGGLWHGAAWTFVIWGAYHGGLLILHRCFQRFSGKTQAVENDFYRPVFSALKMILFFHLICLGWLFFRAASLTQALQMLQGILLHFNTTQGAYAGLRSAAGQFLFYVSFVLGVEAIQYYRKDLMAVFKMPAPFKACLYSLCILLILIFGVTGVKPFIYFQF